MKQKFNVITSSCIPLPLENVDTDQIIPARFLKAIDKEGMGDNLFRDWRYNADGTPKPDFVMNDPSYSGVILVAGKNFGSGSSREHAALAIAGAGFRDNLCRPARTPQIAGNDMRNAQRSGAFADLPGLALAVRR